MLCIYFRRRNGLYEDDDRLAFTRALVNHGAQPALRLVHPRALLDALQGRQGTKALLGAVQPVLPLSPPQLLSHDDLVQLAASVLSDEDLRRLDALWYLGTLASIAYKRLRNPCAHHGGAPDFVSFDQTTYQGRPVPDLGFEMLFPALVKCVAAARDLSVASGKWFGRE